jgi:hypothetical protein
MPALCNADYSTSWSASLSRLSWGRDHTWPPCYNPNFYGCGDAGSHPIPQHPHCCNCVGFPLFVVSPIYPRHIANVPLHCPTGLESRSIIRLMLISQLNNDCAAYWIAEWLGVSTTTTWLFVCHHGFFVCVSFLLFPICCRQSCGT